MSAVKIEVRCIRAVPGSPASGWLWIEYSQLAWLTHSWSSSETLATMASAFPLFSLADLDGSLDFPDHSTSFPLF